MDPAVATGLVRVKVVGEDNSADIALPTGLPIRELIPRIRKTLASGRDDDDLPERDNVIALRPYSLAPPGSTPFSLDATLEALAVDDGELLLLRQLPPGPTAPPVVENIADAAAIHSASQFKPFTQSLLPAVAQIVVLVLGALVCGLALATWHGHHRWWAAIGLGVLAVVYIAATGVLARRGEPVTAARMGVASTVPLALALAAALPGDGAAPRVFLAAAGLAAWSLVMLTLTATWISTYTSMIVVSASLALLAALRIVAHLPYVTLGCVLITISLLTARSAPTAAAVWARFPLPNVPAPDEDDPPPLSLSEIEALPTKVARSNAYQNGMIAASVIMTVIGSVMVVWLPAAPSLLAWWLMIATVMVTVLRMRVWDSAVPALWLLSAPFVAAVALSASFAFSGHLLAAVYAAAALVGLVTLLLVATALKPGALTIPQRRYLTLFEETLLATIFPAMVVLTGLYSLIRNRGAL